jgi:hypothetical protein
VDQCWLRHRFEQTIILILRKLLPPSTVTISARRAITAFTHAYQMSAVHVYTATDDRMRKEAEFFLEALADFHREEDVCADKTLRGLAKICHSSRRLG